MFGSISFADNRFISLTSGSKAKTRNAGEKTRQNVSIPPLAPTSTSVSELPAKAPSSTSFLTILESKLVRIVLIAPPVHDTLQIQIAPSWHEGYLIFGMYGESSFYSSPGRVSIRTKTAIPTQW